MALLIQYVSLSSAALLLGADLLLDVLALVAVLYNLNDTRLIILENALVVKSLHLLSNQVRFLDSLLHFSHLPLHSCEHSKLFLDFHFVRFIFDSLLFDLRLGSSSL